MLKTSLTLFFVVSVIFSTIYTPQAILPTLKDVFHLSMIQTNLLLSGMLFVLMVSTPMYAPITGRFDKKKIMLFSIFFLVIAVIVSALASRYSLLLLSRVMQGVFVPGITAIMLSYVQDIYPQEHRGRGMGIYMAATGFGAVLGRWLAGWTTYHYSWRFAFILFALLLVLSWLAMAWGLPSVEVRAVKQRVKVHQALWRYMTRPVILSVLLIPAVVFFSFMAITTFVTYHLAEAPFLLNASQLGSLFLVLLLSVVVSPLAGRYSDKIGRVTVLIWALLVLILGILLTLGMTVWMIVAGLGLVTIGMFSVQSVAPTYLGDLVPEDRGTVAVVYQTFFYLGGALGTIVPSLAWAYGQFAGVAWLCIGLIVLGVMPFGYYIFVKGIGHEHRTK